MSSVFYWCFGVACGLWLAYLVTQHVLRGYRELTFELRQTLESARVRLVKYECALLRIDLYLPRDLADLRKFIHSTIDEVRRARS